MVQTFALAHFPVMEGLPEDLRILLAKNGDNRPTGALALAAIAVSLSFILLHCLTSIVGRIHPHSS